MGTVKGATAKATQARRALGEQTRLRILQAADSEFAESGYQAATMAHIAARAEVAVQTVYFNFQNKPSLLRALIMQAVMGYAEPERPEDTDWFSAVLEQHDGRAALHAFAQGAVVIFSRASVAAETARLAAPTDPQVAAVHVEAESLREHQFQRITSALEGHGALRHDLTVAKATDVLLTLASAQTYLQLTHSRGWHDDEWAHWLGDALGLLLLDRHDRN
jgi:AcrR family transcriptional regulator